MSAFSTTNGAHIRDTTHRQGFWKYVHTTQIKNVLTHRYFVKNNWNKYKPYTAKFCVCVCYVSISLLSGNYTLCGKLTSVPNCRARSNFYCVVFKNYYCIQLCVDKIIESRKNHVNYKQNSSFLNMKIFFTQYVIQTYI